MRAGVSVGSFPFQTFADARPIWLPVYANSLLFFFFAIFIFKRDRMFHVLATEALIDTEWLEFILADIFFLSYSTLPSFLGGDFVLGNC